MSASTSDAESARHILSREELGALLEGLQEAATPSRALPGAKSFVEQSAGRAELSRVLGEFAAEQGRSLSTLHQTPILFEPTHLEDVSLGDYAAAMLETDRVARLHLGTGEIYLQLGRPLVFGWMELAFGARRQASAAIVPARAYTRIEERFLHRAVLDIGQQLARALGLAAGPVRLRGLEAPVALLARARQVHVVASFEVSGFAEPAPLRIAMPLDLFDLEASEARDEEAAPLPEGLLEGQVRELPVTLRVEAGRAELSLSQLAGLAPGDCIRLTSLHGGGLVARIENRARFRVERGVLGSRLAVQITETLPS